MTRRTPSGRPRPIPLVLCLLGTTAVGQVRVLEHGLPPGTNTFPFAGYHDRTRSVNIIADHTGVYGWAGKGQVNRDDYAGGPLLCLCEFPRSPGDLMAYHGLGFGLWRYRDGEWTQVPPTGFDPGGHANVRLAYEPQRQVAMLYQWNTGGQSETWEFDGTTWTRLAQQSGNIEFVAIYHQIRRQRMHGIDQFGRIYEWMLPHWVQIDALPTSENVVIHGAAYHKGRQQLAAVGRSPTSTVMRTYEHDGSFYSIYYHTVGPIWTPSTWWSTLVYDEARLECVLYNQNRNEA